MKLLFGVGASRGVAEGKCYSLQECKEIECSEKVILVDEFIPPAVITLPSNIVGVVVEDGGILSHAACIAREIGIPCIVNIENATMELHNKQIKMNGESGEIYVL